MSTRQISFAIQGMYCPKCAVKIGTALSQLDGIIAAQVNFASERASVVYDPARVLTATIVIAVRSVGFDTPLERVTLNVRDLTYASSAHMVERILRRADGVVDVSADLRTGRVTVTVLPERASPDNFQVLLTWLDSRPVELPTPNPATGFVLRSLLVIGAAILLILGALNHVGTFAIAAVLPSPLWLIALATFALFGGGSPFYRRAFAAFAHGEYDASVLIALVASVTFFGGLVLALISRDRQAASVWVWSAWGALVLAAILTAGWFIARGWALWLLPHFWHTALAKDLATMSLPQSQVTGESTQPDAVTGSVFARH